MTLIFTPMSRARARISSAWSPGSMAIASPVRREPMIQQFSANTPTTIPRMISSLTRGSVISAPYASPARILAQIAPAAADLALVGAQVAGVVQAHQNHFREAGRRLRHELHRGHRG